MKFDFLVGPIRTVIRFDRFDIFSTFLKDGGSQDSQDFSDKLPIQKARVEKARRASELAVAFCYGSSSRHPNAMTTADIVAMQVRQFQKDRVEQARCGFLFGHSTHISTADILVVNLNQFQKDRDEQARCAFLLPHSNAMSTVDIEAMRCANFKGIETSRLGANPSRCL